MKNKFSSLLKVKVEDAVNDAFRKKIFSACSLGIFKVKNENITRQIFSYGSTGLDQSSEFVDNNTYFDLASLTKPLVTAITLLFLIDRGIIDFSDNLSKFFKNIDKQKQQIKLIHLLTHKSGLPAHRPYFIELIKMPAKLRWNYVIDKILSEQLIDSPGKVCLYSDLGFILLGYIIEIVTGKDLHLFWQENILNPFRINDKIKFPSKSIQHNDIFVETGTCLWSKDKLKGLVNDDNCRALGGIAGHAGLFGTMSGTLNYVENLFFEIKGGSKLLQFKDKTLLSFLKRTKDSSWVNGFDTPGAYESSSGNQFSDRSLGHLGFTGTSFWIDLNKDCGIVLLTNRTIYGESLSSIRKFRPIIHNIVMLHLLNE